MRFFLLYGMAMVAAGIFFICDGEVISGLCILPGAALQILAYFYPILWTKNDKK